MTDQAQPARRAVRPRPGLSPVPAVGPEPYANPGGYDLAVYRGDSYSWQFNLWQDAAKTIPFNLTGYTVKSEIRDSPGGVTIIALTSAVTLPNTIVLTLSSANSHILPEGSGVWDLQLTHTSDGWVSTVVKGGVTVTDDVTDSS